MIPPIPPIPPRASNAGSASSNGHQLPAIVRTAGCASTNWTIIVHGKHFDNALRENLLYNQVFMREDRTKAVSNAIHFLFSNLLLLLLLLLLALLCWAGAGNALASAT